MENEMDKKKILDFLQFEYGTEISAAKGAEQAKDYELAALHLIRADNFRIARKFIMEANTQQKH